MGRRKVSLLHWRLLTQVLVFSVSIVHASKVLDEVPIPEDSELDQTPLRRRRFIVESDDEDFVTSAEGSADFEEGSTPVTVETEHTTLATTEIPEGKTKSSVYPLMIPVVAEMNSSPEPPQYVYYRVLVNFTTSIEYSSQLEDFDSEAFREISEGIIDTLESEFYRIPGDQTVTVVWIKQVDQNVIVELDVGSDGNDNDEEIREVVYSVVRSGSIGPYETSDQGFKFRHLGDDKIPPHRQCLPNEFSCGSGECIPLDYRCDFRADCKDMSDEADCARVITTVSPSPTVRVKVPVTTTTPVIVTVKPERRTPRPLVTPAPATSTPDFLRPCSIDQAVCQNGQCIPRDYLCDGERDCTDGSDELDCGAPSPCEPNEFMCKNGRCALKLWRCDGDNDCMDNSDEEYCPTKGPGDMCAPEQFVCVSTRQCIPASYQCDEEADCPDRSDEFGCTPPQVITPPEETVMVKRGATVTLTCVAAGVPTPIITWRLNWGHIPVSSRITMTSQNGQGTLIIRDAKESDQGAYTCEAINAKGMIFAIPDALLILKSNPGVCSEGQFHVEGSLQCLPCFCFGVTRNCESANRYRNQIHLRFTEEDNFMGVNVTAAAQPVTPPVSTSQMIVDPDSGEFQLVDLSRRFLSHDSFWTLPRQFLGDKVDSYGGSLRFKVRYSVARGQSEPEEKADVIITGNGRKLVYKTRTSTYPDVINQKEILFTEDNWQHESGLPVTREDLMMTLANLDKIMIRTKYDNKMSSIGLSDIVMDTTSVEFTTMGKPKLVEQCRCPPSYKGLSCETCARGFKRVLTGPYLGVCDGCSCNGHASSCDKVTGYCLSCRHNTEGPHCDKCKPGFFGDPTRGTANDCMPCPCPFTDSRRRFSETCFLDTDGRPTCDACSEGYTGRRCEICAAGYEGNPMSPGGKCKPHAGHFSNCDSRGTKSTESYAGSCVCKANVIGRLCNQCATGSFNLNDANLDGCVKCFCMGISKECTSSSWHRDQVRALYDEQESNLYMLTNMAHTQRIIEGIKISALSELTFANFDAIPRDIYYWVLPDRFKGDKVTSYGGELHYTILHNVSPDSLPVTGMPDVVLQGNNIFLEHYTAKRPQPGIPSTFSVSFKETAWRRADGQPATREHLLMALANINAFMIRASYTEGTTESRISQIRMDVAVPHSTGQEQAVEVEECICPEGYKGSSCQECAFGYRRTTSGLYLGMCERCDCNGHSDCDADTGECLKCQHDTKGLRCERCESGFYGNARGGTPNDCKPCPCPGTTPSNQFSSTCFLGADGQATCDHCPSGYEGRNCERCASGYTGNPMYGQSCTTGCTCDWRGSARGQCDANGQCQCKPHVQGRTCDACEAGYFYLSAENREGCLPCFCMGVTQQCSSSSYYRNVVSSPFVPPNNFQNFSLVNRQRTTRITSGFTVTVRDRQPQLSFGRFGQYTQESYYWQLPEVFQGDKVTSYGGLLRYTLSYDAGYRGSSVPDADVQIIGNDITLVTYHHHPLQPREIQSFEIMFKEQFWKRPDGQQATREHLLMVLADLDEVLIRATYSTDMISASLSDVSMEVAVPYYTNMAQALQVEECRCPPAYHGLSCQDCAPGYTRTGGGLYLGDCKLCECNGHSDSCHPETGVCSNCLHNTAGEFCDQCAPGYYGDATVGTPEDCQPCACPLTNQENQFSPICESSRVGGYRCTACLPGYTGQHCERCAPGYSGNPRVAGQKCHPVDHNPFLVTIIPRRATVEQGSTVILKCQVVGQAPFYYYWSRADGHPLSNRVQQRQQGEELVIREIKSADAGIYICTCRNMQSTNSSQTEIIVTVPHFKAITVTVEEPRTQTVRSGVTVNFICTAKSQSPAYTLVWTRQLGGKLPSTAMDFNGILTIRTVRPEDAGVYVCTGSNMFAMDEGTAELHVPATSQLHFQSLETLEGNKQSAAPVATVEPAILTVKQGQTAEFRCTATGNPLPTLEWFGGQGNIISPNAVIQGGLLRIVAVERSDEAEYSCKASNNAGYHIATSILYVQGSGNLPQVQVSPERIEVPEGDTVRLYCRAGGQPSPVISWKKYGGELPPQAISIFGFFPRGTSKNAQVLQRRIQELQAKVERLDIGTLIIPSITVAQAGVYLCVGTNAAGSSEGRIEVSVLTSEGSVPVIRIHPSPGSVTEGDTLELYCHVTGDPQPKITWRKRSGYLTDNHQVQGPMLRIRQATHADAGDYICHAENSLGMQEVSVSVSVSPSAFPKGTAPIVRIQPSPTSVGEGEMLELHCQATGHPEPRITWYRVAGSLSANHQVQGPVLRIRHMTPADIGDYICRAENEYGAREVKFSVSVTSTPSHQGTAPTVLVHPSPSSVREGDMLELHCQVTGQPEPRITWHRSAGSLTSNHQVQGRVLRILRMRPADVGDYICRAENIYGTQEVKFSVLVLPSTSQGTAPTVLVHPSPSSVREGDMLELHCQVTGQPEPRITWHRSAGSLTSNHQVQGRVLRILRMRPADVGDYICRAENIYGTQEVKFSVLVLPSTSRNAPTVLVQPTPTTVREGEMLQLHCQVTGQPPPRVTWYRAAGSLTTDHQVQGHVLRILRVSPADTGDYICRAENVYGMREVKFSVSVTPSSSQGIAPTVRINPSTTSVSEGEMLELHCQVTGQPEPRVTWHRATGSLTANHQVHGRVLRILHVSPADTGDYICRAENIAGTREFKFSVSLSSTTFTHEGAPIVRVQPQPVSVMEGEMVELHCQITAQPEPMITWYKADGYLTDNHQVEGPVLRILQVTSADDGDYICRAENIFGMQQLKFSVMVTSTTSRELLPIISTGPQDITVIEGGDASFSCQVVDGAQPFSIKWKTPNEPLQANVKISNDGSVIKITRARQRDQGQYKCVAQNRFGSAFSIMTLVVQGPPTVSISPRGPVRLGVGDSVTLECIGMGEPRPTIRWRRVNGRQRNNLPREGNPILTISSARLQDSGTYSCTSSNMFGSVDSQVEVIVERSASTPQVPQVTAEEPSVTVTAGQIATLRCSATGYPTPIIQWSKLRAPLPWQHRIANGSLVIPNVGLQDSGQYICNASNSAGFNELFITLDVETAPYATFDQEVVTVRVGEIIRLHCLSQGTPPITYEWSKVNGSLPSRAVKRNGFLQINLAVVSDSGKYRCMVKNKVGQSDAISTVTVKSPPAVKVSPQIEVRNIGGTVEFTCAATGHPEPRTEWFKEEGQFLSNHRINKGVLRIENIQEGNEGVYVCRASNPFGRVQDSAKLVIQALPIVMINVRASMQMVMVGGSVEFECQAIGDPQPSIRWSKVDGRLSPEVILKNGMLKIDHVKESDAGRYRCTATNDAGSVKSEVVLYVQTVPMIAPQPELKEVTIGSKAVFPCLASGYPEPEITWTKLEGDLPTGAYVENHVLTIPSATTEHTGTYVCTATNEQGTETAYAMLKVRERKIPYFTQDPIAYIALPTIKDAYHEFEISITFRPDAADGMIIYNGQKQTTGADFISFSLVGGRPEFRFDVGSGMATIRHPNPITLGEYHNVVLYRNLTHGSLFVDNDPPINGSSQGNFRGLDLNEELYVGGYPHFENISKVTGSNSGFMGCIRKLVIQGDEVIFSAPDLKARGISDCPTCKDNPCKNGGQCIDSETGSYACHCRKGYTGSNCEHSLALHCHPEACGSDATCVNRPDGLGYICRCHLGKQGPKCMDGVLITSPSFRGGHSFVAYPPLTNIHNELTIELEFKPYAPTGLMFYSSGQRMKMNDFISVAMLNGHLEFRYDLGSGLAVLQSANPVALNKWHRLKAHRHNKDGLLKIDDEKEIRKVSPGKSQGLNLRSPMYLGGVPSSEVLPKAVNVTEGMEGCITKVSINGKKVDLSYTFTDSLNVDQCYDSSPCDRAPCLHGGRCIVTGEYEYQCICTNEYQGENCEISWDICLQGNPCMNGGTCDKNQCWCPMGYTGSYCELGMSAVTPAPEWHMEGSADSPVQYGAFFHDGGYIVLPKQMFPRSSPTAPETIEMEVHTTSLDGILLWQGVKHGENGKGKDFVALGLQNGHVLFSYQLGSGEANILSEDPINDGEWHRIIAVREGKSGYIQLDGEDIVRGESKGDKVMVNTRGSVYLGGAPDVELFTGGKFTSGITGCIRKVVLVNKRPDQHQVQPVDLRVHAEGGVNARECPS
ncbi:basement membrane-specific heparan sulfate proteoglycan core protein isoform X10 [Stegostoma tigrinum]|uniref:basement membrane-specific heparan sulfate proteoglycan core protein isoform X10 n=1 Tax=Stegostoma tigrinum TaxID=3053191 RepID=UPI00287088FC|nr:basement membrane-specific heparan sulfate proteoglycan core protein isoform X10 [Stegostoma tigrinum]